MSDALDKAKLILEQENSDGTSMGETVELKDFVRNEIRGNLCYTIAIKYILSSIYVTSVYSSSTKLQKFSNYSITDYEEFCDEVLDIDFTEKYNCSRAINVDGIRTRVFALMPPLTKTPEIVISTTKSPPATLVKQTIKDETFDKIVHSNFIVVGASGSGKTFLTNYLLSKFIAKDERIALIDEFGELIPPNELTTCIVIPPPKPGEESALQFVMEQSNLMRLNGFYVGEIKGKEAWPFVVNLASGTRGGSTVHGETAQQGLSRLRALCQLSCDSDEVINDFIAKSIKYIIVMKKTNIEQIYELTGTHMKNNFTMKEIGS